MNFIDMPSPNGEITDKAWQSIALHGTAGSLASALSWLRNPQPDNPKARVSAHFVVAKSGLIYRLRNFEKKQTSWAQGYVEHWDKSLTWLARALAAGTNPNEIVVSIEHEAYSNEMIGRAKMTDAQFTSSINLTAYILRKIGKKAGHEEIVSHSQISGADRYNCPGVIFVPAYTEQLIKRNPDLRP